jgi:hypothetical protein
MQPLDQALRDIEARERVLELLGTAEDRKGARLRVGLSLRAIAEAPGLSEPGVRLRESPRWRMTRGSLESEANRRYVRLIGRARGLL